MRYLAIIFFVSTVFSTTGAWSFPQYADWISKRSGHEVNCSYCHLNPHGPIGNDFGQEGTFDEKDLEKTLHTPKSLVLNSFGRSIIKHLGYHDVVVGITNPAGLAEIMKVYDLDGDGISDGVEMEYGTAPNDPLSAPPNLIWKVLLDRNQNLVIPIALCGLFGMLGFFGLARALKR
jgi:hypothetical protein